MSEKGLHCVKEGEGKFVNAARNDERAMGRERMNGGSAEDEGSDGMIVLVAKCKHQGGEPGLGRINVRFMF